VPADADLDVLGRPIAGDEQYLAAVLAMCGTDIRVIPQWISAVAFGTGGIHLPTSGGLVKRLKFFARMISIQ
jgi:hypothetical protein